MILFILGQPYSTRNDTILRGCSCIRNTHFLNFYDNILLEDKREVFKGEKKVTLSNKAFFGLKHFWDDYGIFYELYEKFDTQVNERGEQKRKGRIDG